MRGRQRLHRKQSGLSTLLNPQRTQNRQEIPKCTRQRKTVIIEPANPTDIKYAVWVGATQVTGANKNDILGDGGKAKFDPSTATLTLNNPIISTNYSSGGKTHKIYAAEDITVKGSYTMTSYAADYGIYGYMNLTLDGDFTVLSGIHGVYARFTITINGSLVGRANSTTYNSSAGIKASRIAFGTVTRVEAEGKKVYIQHYSETIKKRKSEMKRTIDLIDEIISEGQISDANLRQLIDKIIIYETGEGLRIQVNLKADFTEHMIIFNDLGKKCGDLKAEGKNNYPFAMRRRMRFK